ncbi:hypothetical protein H310_13386 [Aphanomyces invadans]|uniref:Sidoreflexin n=1 Tax=Aphanomyces invadans TaxID=157072 RepID=A0A024TE68_9STRA|nr:hypothetical protein H310_13386 [Aphanomyces invadans]ETV92343.1 hypothetical protein H310_13386 [Aphanomyces invadans]|eukprot:XP_008879094.1 hypothetical protein H310_13386 [Aphanomyces invadans]
MASARINLDAPRWDQSTFEGRAKHFFTTTNPINVLASDEELDAAKSLVEQYRRGAEPAGTTPEQVWAAKHLYDSAFHPDTGEKNFILGRMSFQVPGNMVITGCMMAFYRSTPAVVFWQFMNQTFNSIVNYTNRNASTGVTTDQLLQAYAAASTMSVATAVGLNKFIASRPALSGGIVGRLVPLMAVAAANWVNIPMMRQQELLHGIAVETADGEVVGKSRSAAQSAVLQVVPSRILMAVPGMAIPPVVIAGLEKGPLKRMPALSAPLMVLLTGACLSLSTPLCCALFPQKSAISTTALEPEIQDIIRKRFPETTELYYNKGL